MSWVKRLVGSRPFQKTTGTVAAEYLRLVWKTTRLSIEPRIAVVPRIPSLALRLARVATGALDGTFTAPNSRDWDLAAADLLVHEAGGLITTLTGERLIYNRPDPVHGALVAAGRARHGRLLDLIRDRLSEFA